MTISVSTWKGNNINDGVNYSSFMRSQVFAAPPAQAQMALRSGRGPLFATMMRPGIVLLVETFIDGASTAALRAQLRQWFDPDDETPGQLVINGDEGNDQYIEAICEGHYTDDDSAGLSFVSVLRVHDDQAWRKTTATTPSNWSVTASGQTQAYSNAGEKDVYPIYSITPTSAKSGSNPFKRFFAVHWRGEAATAYPVDVADNSLDTRPAATNFASTVGNDIRVFVNGQPRNFWLDGINTTTTKIWVNLNFKKGQTATLETALGSGSIETIDVDEDISGWPEAGIIQIEGEIFIYSSKNDSLKRFFVESRGAKGTSAVTHNAGVLVRWIQNDVVVTYGSVSLSAYPVSDTYKPIFNLATSSNTSWDYDEFGDDAELRTGRWIKGVEFSDWAVNYTADQDSDADPWTEIGIKRSRVDMAVNPYFYVYNPCGISNANFQNGQKYAGFGEAQWNGAIYSGINGPNEFLEVSIADPTLAATWQSWSQNEALRSGSKYVGILLQPTYGGGGTDMKMEAADVTLTLVSGNAPVITVVAEQGNYTLDAVLTNNTTGDALAIAFEMELNETLEIDTYNRTVTYLADGSNQYGAVSRVGGARRDWLKLQPGSNTLQFDDSGTAGVTVAVSYEERYGA